MTLSLLCRATFAVVCCGLVSACSPGSSEPVASTAAAPPTSAPELADAPPVPTLPSLTRGTMEPCPYLDGQWLAEANGQRLTDQSVDRSFVTPACVFFSYPQEPQAIVMVRHMSTVDDAYAVVDWAAPVGATSPAETAGSFAEQEGWTGGRGVLQPGAYSAPEFEPGMYPGTTFAGAVYAVSKGTVAVVVWTNQEQTVKAEAIAQEAITNLGL